MEKVQTGGKMESDKLELSFKNFDTVNSLITNCDTKSSIIFTITGIIFGLSYDI